MKKFWGLAVLFLDILLIYFNLANIVFSLESTCLPGFGVCGTAFLRMKDTGKDVLINSIVLLVNCIMLIILLLQNKKKEN